MMNLTLVIVSIYLCMLPVIGLLARQQSHETSLKDYYLASGMVTALPLFFTLYATQYSGNTLLGIAGKSYREGPLILFTALGLGMVVPIYMLFAKRLQKIGQSNNFITITDYFKYRYKNPNIAKLANLALMLALCSYILTNFKAIGLLVESITNGQIPLFWAVFIMAIAMAFYESLGGMRSVIWTDIIQGTLLLLGCISVITLVLIHFDGANNLITQLQMQYTKNNWQPMNASQWRKGISITLLVSIGISLYPHAIQRIYAAKNWITLKRTFLALMIMPLFTVFPIVIAAMSTTIIIPNLTTAETERVIPHLLQFFMQTYPVAKYFLALFMAAALAAIMSTIDSAMLALGASLTQDVFRPLAPNTSQEKLTKISKYLTWVLMFTMAFLATQLPQSIWKLLVLKLEIMLQVAPALILGIHYEKLKDKAIFTGLTVGIISLLWLRLGASYGLPVPNLYNIHAGVWALIINLIIITLIQKFSTQKTV